MIKLYEKKEDCCGCGACFNICNKNAIEMKEDIYGYIYPYIKKELCIECGACKKVCAYQNSHEYNLPKQVLAATSNNNIIKLNSSSGGIFSILALNVLGENGIVFGSYLDQNMIPKHIAINNESDLGKIQGSKYVQSNIGNTYSEAKEYLVQGKKVLFSGTPCQIDGLKYFLKKEYENLITIDIICHGVPSSKLFKDYILYMEKNIKGKILDFRFRDKTKGWGLTGKITYRNSKGIKSKMVYCKESSYYNLFLNGDIYRESCYKCKYACKERVGDITLGDYWGIESEHPEINSKNIKFNKDKGVSSVIVNTSKGLTIIKESKSYMESLVSNFDKVAKHNNQLVNSSKKSEIREEILDIYLKKGYEGIEEYFRHSMGKKLKIIKIYNRIPNGIKKYKKLLTKR